MSETPYGFEAAKLRAARTAAGASVARIARAAGRVPWSGVVVVDQRS
ncbi:hypothetical protein [Kitasatospora sp. NPDC094011]